MTTTVTFSWHRVFGGTSDPADYIAAAISDLDEPLTPGQLDAIERDFRDAINQMIAGSGMVLAGDQFYGFLGDDVDVDELREAIDTTIDFWGIVIKHDARGN